MTQGLGSGDTFNINQTINTTGAPATTYRTIGNPQMNTLLSSIASMGLLPSDLTAVPYSKKTDCSHVDMDTTPDK